MLMRDIRMRIKEDNIDLEELFAQYGFNKDSVLKIEELEKFLKEITPTLSC